MKNRRQSFTAQFQSDLIEFKTHEGAEYIVAPCVAIVAGVLNEALVPMHAIESTFRAWNGRPIVVDHPMGEDGEPISANEPGVIESAAIGQIWHAQTDEKRLQVEAWVNVAKAEQLGGDALLLMQRLKNKEPIEVSTGYWGVFHDQQGKFQDQEYKEVTDLIIPDHLAFLPHAIGACNWGDGCGVPRFNEAETSHQSLYETVKRAVTHVLSKSAPLADVQITSNMTVSDQFAILSSLLFKEAEEMGVDMWRWHIVDIEDQTVIVQWDGALWRRGFTINEFDDIELSGDWEEVNRKTTFTPAIDMLCECQKLKTEGSSNVNETLKVEEQHPDTLAAFLAERQLTEADVLAALETRQNTRTEAIAKIKEHVEIPEAELIAMSDKALKALADSYLVAITTENETRIEGPGLADFSGRGAPVVKSLPDDGVPTSPRVLRTISNRPNQDQLLKDSA